MNTKLFLSMFMLVAFLFGTKQASAVVKTSLEKQESEYYLDVTPEDLLKKSVRTLHRESGRSFSFKERLALRMIKKQLTKSGNTDLNAAYKEAKLNTLAILGFSSGVLTYLLIFVPFAGLVLIPGAIILSSIALKQIENSGGRENGSKLARAGLILGLVAAGIVAILLTLAIIGLGVGF